MISNSLFAERRYSGCCNGNTETTVKETTALQANTRDAESINNN